MEKSTTFTSRDESTDPRVLCKGCQRMCEPGAHDEEACVVRMKDTGTRVPAR